MKNSIRLLAAILLFAAPHAHAGLFGGNKMDDLFVIKSVGDKQAVAEGAPNGLKAGDTLYFAHSPFQFSVTEVKGNQVTIALPERHDLAVGQSLMRKANDQVKKGIDTEKRLKQAIEE